MAQVYSLQIQDLVGSFSDTGALSQWMNDGIREIVNILPGNMKQMCYAKQTFTSALAGSESETIASQHLGNILAGSVACRLINSIDKHKASDSSHIQYATATDPVWYLEGGKINILPASLSGIYYIIAEPAIDSTAVSNIPSFPNEAEYLVVLYASCKALQRLMTDSSTSSNIIAPVLETTSLSLPTFTAPSDFIVPAVPSGANVDVSSLPTIPTYTKPVFAEPTYPTISSMSLPSAPAVPPLSAVNVGTLPTTVPSYIQPVLATDFGDANTWLNTEEDSEMVRSRIEVIQGQIQEFQAKSTDELNKFNKEKTEYDAKLSKVIQDAKLDGDDESRKLTKFQAELSAYQQDVNKEVTRWTAEEYTKKYQEWIGKYTNRLQEYSQNIASESARVTLGISNFKEEFGKAIQVFQAETGYDLGLFSADLQGQTAKYQSSLSIQTETFRASLDKYTMDLKRLTDVNASILSKFATEIQNFSAKLDKSQVEYSWYQSQYIQLKNDYLQGLQFLVQGDAAVIAPQPKQQQQRRQQQRR